MKAVTGTGWSVLVGSLAVWLVSWSFGYEELGVVAVCGLVAFAVALLWTGARPRLRVARHLVPDRVVRGDSTEVRATITNPSRRLTPSLAAVDRVGERDVPVVIPSVGAGEERALTYSLPTDRRGVLTVGPLNVVSEDPLGLIRRERRVGGTATLWVYPRTHPVQVIPSGRVRDLEGPTSDSAAGSITFHSLREYVTGDDLRLIHWRSTARTGQLMVRHQSDPSRPRCDIVLDTAASSYADPEEFEAAVEGAASMAMALTSHRFPVRLHTADGITVDSARGRSAAQALLDRLAAVDTSRSGTLADAARTLSSTRAGNAMVVLTGRPASDELVAVETLRRRFDVFTVVRFQLGVEPSAELEGGILQLLVPDAEAFAQLWNRRMVRA